MNIQKKIHSHHAHRSEQISVFLSLACAIHCMLTPILVVLMPVAGAYFERYHWIDYVIILSVIILGSSSLYHGYKLHHQKMLPVGLFGFGVFFLIFGSILHIYYKDAIILHHLLTAFGGIFCGIAQFLNLRLSK
ncbi:MAG: MerC domain-containing protein [Chitinophagales bacterium]